MTISEFSEVAVPVIGLSEDDRQVTCRQCYSTMRAVHVAANGYQCLTCNALVCVMCGCTDDRACIGGCYWWLSPGICSSHKQELHELALKVFGGAR